MSTETTPNTDQAEGAQSEGQPPEVNEALETTPGNVQPPAANTTTETLPPPTPPVSDPPAPTVTTPPPPAAPEPVTLVYFKKVQVNMPFFIGKERVKFEVLGTNVGVAAFDPEKDLMTVMELNKAAAAKRGGIVKIDVNEYDRLKKKLTLPTSEQRPQRSPVRVFKNLSPFPQPKKPAVPGQTASVAVGEISSPQREGGQGAGGETAGAGGAAPATSEFKPATGPKLGGKLSPRPLPPLPPVTKS